jgi:hypothetical protein
VDKREKQAIAGIRGLGSAGDLQGHQAKGAQSISGKVHPCGRRTGPEQIWRDPTRHRWISDPHQGCDIQIATSQTAIHQAGLIMNQVKQFDEIPERILNGDPGPDLYTAGRINVVYCDRNQMDQVMVKNTGSTTNDDNFLLIDNSITGVQSEIYLFILDE